MSFYRTYRPQIIDEIDNPQVSQKLLSLLSKPVKDLPHAYLFSGPKGTGKTTAARILAKIFNCQKPTKHGPCGTCEQCVAIARGNHMDVLEIDAASNRGIDEIRELRDRISLTPTTGSYKVYIIDEVHMLTTEAFNALLKTLEEPPKHAVFVLATTDPQKVPATIKSRCVSIVFNRADPTGLTHALRRIVSREKISIDEEAITLIADYADGSFRDAVKMLEQVSFHKGKIAPDVVRSLLSMSEDKIVDKFIADLAVSDAAGALSIIGGLMESGSDIKTFLVDCLRKLEQCLIARVTGKPQKDWTTAALQDLIRRLSLAYTEMKTVSIPQLPLELAVIEYCGSKNDMPPPHEEDHNLRERESVKDESKKPEERIKHAAEHLPHETEKSGGETEDTEPTKHANPAANSMEDGLLTLEKLTVHWKDFIESMKPFNHSVSGVLRSSRPKAVRNGIVTIEAFYKFHQEKLSEVKTREVISEVLKKLFGETVKVEIVLGKK